MIEDASSSEKGASVGLEAHTDARALVRLIQCTICSRPFRTPIALPCGNSICRACLPTSHQRENISYPDVPGRRTGINCPFSNCALEHPASDCNIDVVLTKVMEVIAEVVAKRISIGDQASTLMEEQPALDELVDTMAEKAPSHERPGGRLVATYSLAAEGKLDYKTGLGYEGSAGSADAENCTDIETLHDILESAHRDVDCQVCYNVLLDPVTTFCGHTLCRRCMTRVLDHSLQCPVCRRPLAIPPLLRMHPSNKALSELLNGLCPELITARAEAAASEDLPDGQLDVPLFVCTLGFPDQPTLLRIFEPRYRLMLRRALEGNREFGLLMWNRYHEPQGDLGPVHFYHYGTMLHISRSQLLMDGSSLVESRGAYRFRVAAHGELDGYAVGRVERFDDIPLADEERIEAEETALPPAAEGDDAGTIDRMPTQDLLALGHEFLAKMQRRSSSWLPQRMLAIYGSPPNDAAHFPYWFASVFPINEDEKYKLLPTRTVRERMKITATWIRRIESQRWGESEETDISQVPE